MTEQTTNAEWASAPRGLKEVLHTDIHTYIHAYIQKSMHTYIHTYIHMYIHTEASLSGPPSQFMTSYVSQRRSHL